MPPEDRKYVRVYHDDLIRDYPQVYEDDALLSAWLRLLVIADAMWPTPPELPRSIRAKPLGKLTEIGLVIALSGHRYRIRGLDAERSKRQDAARNAAAKRWHSDGNAKPMPSRAEPSKAESEPSKAEHSARDGLPNVDQDAIDALEMRTGRPVQVAGDKQLTEYDRLIADHGLGEVCIAMDRLREGKTLTARQLVWGAMKVLEPMVDTRKVADTERAEEVERNSRRGVEATQRYLAELRSVGQPR